METDHIQIVCPACMGVNRLPATRSPLEGKCGRCKKPLIAPAPTELTAQSFGKFIAKNSLPVLVDFWAPWCAPCKMMGPEFSKAAKVLAPKVVLAKLNTQDHQMIAAQYNISGIPNMIMFKNGVPAVQQAGAMKAAEITSWALANL